MFDPPGIKLLDNVEFHVIARIVYQMFQRPNRVKTKHGMSRMCVLAKCLDDTMTDNGLFHGTEIRGKIAHDLGGSDLDLVVLVVQKVKKRRRKAGINSACSKHTDGTS